MGMGSGPPAGEGSAGLASLDALGVVTGTLCSCCRTVQLLLHVLVLLFQGGGGMSAMTAQRVTAIYPLQQSQMGCKMLCVLSRN